MDCGRETWLISTAIWSACGQEPGKRSNSMTRLMRDCRLLVAAGAVVAGIFAALGADPQNPQSAVRNPQSNVPDYVFKADHSRDGIGKFYMGREIAHVMGHQAADWLERPEREEEERTTLLVESLGIQPGQAVADIGAGTGYFSRRLSKLVGPKGQILAVDIQPEMLDLLTNAMAGAKITNVKPILGRINDPNLPTNAVDLVLMVDV